MFDKKNEGSITLEELHIIVKGLNRSPQDVSEIMHQYSIDPNQRIDFETFLLIMTSIERIIKSSSA